jgi:hypothetical protein
LQYQQADREDQHSDFSFFFYSSTISLPSLLSLSLWDPALESGEVEEEEEGHDEELRQRVARKLGAMDTRVHPCVPKLVNAQLL